MNWLEKVSEKYLRGCKLIAVRKSAPVDSWIIDRHAFHYIKEKRYFSVWYITGDGETDNIDFDLEDWKSEIVENLFLFKRVRMNPTHHGSWPRPDSDLYIIVTGE